MSKRKEERSRNISVSPQFELPGWIKPVLRSKQNLKEKQICHTYDYEDILSYQHDSKQARNKDK